MSGVLRMTPLSPPRESRPSEQALELDHAIRNALVEKDGEIALNLTVRFCALLPAFAEPADAEQTAQSRQALDMLASQRELAEAQREQLRGELGELARQRQLVAGQRPSQPPRPQRSFLA
jgi:hypothetical protein